MNFPIWTGVTMFLGLVPPLMAAEPLIVKQYAVADLVVPVGENSKDAATRETELISLLKTTIHPETWSARNGGTIQYSPRGHTLSVKQTKEVQQEISQLLNALRKPMDVEVVLEVRLVSISIKRWENWFRTRSSSDWASWYTHKSMTISELEMAEFLTKAQGDRQTNILQAPKMTLSDGQLVRVEIDQGFQLQAKPRLSADQKHVNVQLGLRSSAGSVDQLLSIPNGHTAVVPVVSEPQKMGLAFVTARTVATVEQERNVHGFPTSEIVEFAAALVNGTAEVVQMMAEGPSWYTKGNIEIGLSFGRSSTEEKAPAQTLHAVVPPTPQRLTPMNEETPAEQVIRRLPLPPLPSETPRIAQPPNSLPPIPRVDEKGNVVRVAAQDPVSRPSTKLEKVMEKYHQACAAGDTKKAKKFAVQALELDPTCFGSQK